MTMKVMLKELRGDRNLEDVAAKLDVAVSTIQRWERQTMSIPSFRLPAIAEAYGCKISDIFAENE
jgi:transcriptional regulator with XRE-family HTH domain